MKTQKSFYAQYGGAYTQVGDVLLPNLTIGEDGQQPVGKYGRMRMVDVLADSQMREI